MVHGPDFYIRFVNYVFGDEIRIMAPTVGLIAVMLAFMLLVHVLTALYFHFRQNQRVERMIKEKDPARENELRQLIKENEMQKRELKVLQDELVKCKEAVGIARELIRSAGEALRAGRVTRRRPA